MQRSSLSGGVQICALLLLISCLAIPAEGADPRDVAVLVTQVPRAVSQDGAGSGPFALPGLQGRILLVQPDGSQRCLTEGFHSAADPAVSFDAQRCLFAGKRAAADPWNVYEYDFATGQTRQITRDGGNCRQPSYQSNLFTVDSPEPWFQLTFVSDRAGWISEDGKGPSWSLFSCRLDGSDVRQLTYNLSHDLDPFLMGDGRLLYACQQRRTQADGPLGRMQLFAVNIEGTDQALFAELSGGQFKRMPCVTDRGLVLFVETDQLAADGAGQLGSVTFRRPLKSYRPVTSESQGYAYRCPSPWSQGSVLVARRALDGSGTTGIFLFDPRTGATEAVLDAADADEVQAVAVRPVRQPDGRSTVVDDAKPHGQLYCLNVNVHDMPDSAWLPPGTVRRIRVLEGVPLSAAEWVAPPDGPASGAGAEPSAADGLPALAQRRFLGETEIQADGSLQLTVPANTPIELQTLDEHGLALRTCGWIWAKNVEARGCIGCHEDGELTPENRYVDALSRKSVALTLPPERRRTVDFRRDVMPIVEAKCVSCHGPDGAPPRLDGGLAPASAAGPWNRAYVNLLARSCRASVCASGTGAHQPAGLASDRQEHVAAVGWWPSAAAGEADCRGGLGRSDESGVADPCGVG